MTITFADPGVNYTVLLVFLAVAVAIGLVYILGNLGLKHGDPRTFRGWTYHWPTHWGVASLVAFGAAVCIGLPCTYAPYSDSVQDAKVIALMDSGFDVVSLTRGDDDPRGTFYAERDGEPFKGLLISDPSAAPGTYQYRIMEVEVSK